MSDPGLAKPKLAQGIRRLFFVLLGLLFLGLAILGVFLPLLPTTPFLLLASYFFVRSSPAWHAWLLRSRLFGPFLLDWQRHRGVRPRVKVTAVITLLAAVSTSILLTQPELPILILFLVLAATGLWVVLRLPVIRETKPASEEALLLYPPSQDERVSA